ncbi:MAG: hypothetical protein ACT4P5_22180 [Armatimonadota bacterium]
MKTATALLLAGRTLQTRPRRTAILLLGYGLGLAVMIALLAVGDALLLQAQDRDVTSGGDLVLVPAGVDPEVLKTGAVTAMFLAIPNARALVRQILLGPRYAETIAAASPEMIDKLVYVRIRGEALPVRASGVIPSAAASARSALAIADPRWRDREEDRTWLAPSPAQTLAAIDGFHEAPAGRAGQTWAEWWYFNFTSRGGLYGYVSFIADRERRVLVSMSLRHPDGRLIRMEETHPGTVLPFSARAIAAGPHRVELRKGLYSIRIARADVGVDLEVRPVPGLYLPPIEQQAGTFRSGYVVPALRASVTGSVRLGTERRAVEGTGYHDHNWGIWQAVTWEWGTASTPEYALLAGLVRHPTLRGQEMLVTLHAVIDGRAGVLGILRGSAPILSDWKPGPVLGRHRVRIPGRLRYRAANDAGDRLTVEIVIEDTLATRLRPSGLVEGREERPETRVPSGREVFVQIKGRYVVSGTVGGRRIVFSAPGFAETFVAAPRAP